MPFRFTANSRRAKTVKKIFLSKKWVTFFIKLGKGKSSHVYTIFFLFRNSYKERTQKMASQQSCLYFRKSSKRIAKRFDYPECVICCYHLPYSFLIMIKRKRISAKNTTRFSELLFSPFPLSQLLF